MDILFKELNNKGFNVSYTIHPKFGFGGEYYVYKVVDGKKVMVFSNYNKHEKEGAIIDLDITSSNVHKVIEKVIG